MDNFYIVIMAGGSGTRLWPISRANLPKQLHKFSSDEKSLLQETYNRIKGLVPKKNIYVSVVENIFALTKAQLPEVLAENFIIEPEGKNTAPAIGLISTIINFRNPEAIIATIASDHTIENESKFREAIKLAQNYLQKNKEDIVTVGLEPTEPNTGYGYIKKGRKIFDQIYKVDKFVEKPNLKTAQSYLDSGEYLWNASYFIFNASSMLASFQELAPESHARLERIAKSINSIEFQKILKKEYGEFLKEPIDTVIAEKHSRMVVIPGDFGWSDVGTWSSLYELLSNRSGQRNVSKGHHIGLDNENCLVYAQDKLLATVGLEDIVIVDTPDVTLICNRNKSQDIKKLTDKLKEIGQDKYL